MGKWEMVRLGDVCDIQSGGTPSRAVPENWTSGIGGGIVPWVKISDMKKKYVTCTAEVITTIGLSKSSAKIFPSGTILYTIFATLGEVAILAIDAATNQAIAGITTTTLLSSNFLYYYLTSIKEKTLNSGRGVAQSNINLSILRNIQIPLPPFPVQQKIADVLDRASALIEKRKAQIAKLDLLIKSQFIEMFRYETCIPKLLKEIADVMGGLTKNTSHKVTGKKYPLLRVANVYSDRFDLSEVHSIIVEENKVNRVLLRKGDLLFVEGNGSPTQIGRVAVWEGQIEPCVHQNHLIKVRFVGEISPIYAKFYFMTPVGREQIVRLASSTSGLYTLNLEKIGTLSLPVPTFERQTQFSDLVRQVEAYKSLLQQSLAKLELNYKSLMQKCFRGELV